MSRTKPPPLFRFVACSSFTQNVYIKCFETCQQGSRWCLRVYCNSFEFSYLHTFFLRCREIILHLLENQKFDFSNLLLSEGLNVEDTSSLSFQEDNTISDKRSVVTHSGQVLPSLPTNVPFSSLSEYKIDRSQSSSYPHLPDQPRDIRRIQIPNEEQDSFAVNLFSSFSHNAAAAADTGAASSVEPSPARRPGTVSDVVETLPYPEPVYQPDTESFPTFYVDSELSGHGSIQSTKSENELFQELHSHFSDEEFDDSSVFGEILSKPAAVEQVRRIDNNYVKDPLQHLDEQPLEVIYLSNNEVFVPEVSSVNYEAPTQPTAFNFSAFEEVQDQLAQKIVHPSRYNLSYKDRPPSIEILKKSKQKYNDSTTDSVTAKPLRVDVTLVSSFFNDQELAKYSGGSDEEQHKQFDQYHYEDGFLIDKNQKADERSDDDDYLFLDPLPTLDSLTAPDPPPGAPIFTKHVRKSENLAYSASARVHGGYPEPEEKFAPSAEVNSPVVKKAAKTVVAKFVSAHGLQEVEPPDEVAVRPAIEVVSTPDLTYQHPRNLVSPKPKVTLQPYEPTTYSR